MYSLLGAGIIFLCEGLTVLYCIINNVSARRFKIWLNICNFLCANILLIAFIVIFIAIRTAIDGEISVSVPLAVMAALTTAIGLVSLILNIKALKY